MSRCRRSRCLVAWRALYFPAGHSPNQPVGLAGALRSRDRRDYTRAKANLEGVRTVDPNPDYDASDEVEYFFNWFTYGLRGIAGPGGGYPPPAYPPV